MDESFGITPPTDTLGCLQDVHWSAGYIGSFASYTIGAEPNETTSYCITHTHTHTQTHTHELLLLLEKATPIIFQDRLGTNKHQGS